MAARGVSAQSYLPTKSTPRLLLLCLTGRPSFEPHIPNDVYCSVHSYEFNGRTLKVHHDKFSQGSDALSPSFGPLSGQSTHAPTSPIPALSLSRSGLASASAGLGSPSFAQQQMLSLHQPQSYQSGVAPSPQFYLNSLQSRPGSPFPPQAYLGNITRSPRSNPMEQPHEYQDFAHTPGAPPFQVQQHASFAQHLRSTLATPPPAPLRPSPSARSSGRSNEGMTSGAEAVSSEPHPEANSNVTLSSDLISATRGNANKEQSSSQAPAPRGSTAAGPGPSSRSSGSRKRAQGVGNGNGSTDFRRPPGTISLPPSHAFSVNPLSPHMTRGIPMTPSMPGFTFHAPMSTPPLPHHLLSPGLGPFSPPITFYNPYLNPAPGAPLHVGGQHEPAQSIFAISNAFGPPSPHHMLPSQLSPLHHPMHGPGPEYFQMPGSPHELASAGGYFQVTPMPPPSGQPSPSRTQAAPLNPPTPSQPPDYFAGAVSVTESGASPSQAPLPPGMPIDRTSSGGIGSTGRGSDGTGHSTIPSSSGASSPRGGQQGEASVSSRGTSLPAESDEFPKHSIIDSPPPGTVEHRILQQHRVASVSGNFPAPSAGGANGLHSVHGRAKSQSPNDSISSFNMGPIHNGSSGGPPSERRMSWNDASGVQRNLARLSLEERGGDPAAIGRSLNR